VRLLVLGGTGFLGATVCREARAAGHEVTAVARGVSGRVPEGVRWVQADRDREDALAEVRAEPWDAVVDVARQPHHVRRAVRDLAPVAGHYVFVSSGSAYAETPGGRDEDDTPLLPALPADEMQGPQDYGPAKVAAEQLVVAAFGAERSLLVRAGLIGGPGDRSGRSGYWPWRLAHPGAPDGRVLVPDADDQPVQLVDVRDLATWVAHAARHRVAGAMDAVGPTTPLGDVLALARAVAGHRGPLVPAPATWLQEQGVQPWAGPRSLPLWLGGEPTAYALMQRTGARARAHGLATRPLAQTFADELATLERPPSGAGLTDEEHRSLLDALARRQDVPRTLER
jgi:2'-hydroxyisoflavone reductase